MIIKSDFNIPGAYRKLKNISKTVLVLLSIISLNVSEIEFGVIVMKTKKYGTIFIVFTILLVAMMIYCHVYRTKIYYRNMSAALLNLYYFSSVGRYICGLVLWVEQVLLLREISKK